MAEPPRPALPPIARYVLDALSRDGELGGCELMRSVSRLRAVETPLVSIHRALGLLRSRGLVVQSVTSKRWALRDPQVCEPLMLIVCRSCGGLVQRPAARVTEAVRGLARVRGFKPAEAHLEALGLCLGCQARGDATRLPSP